MSYRNEMKHLIFYCAIFMFSTNLYASEIHVPSLNKEYTYGLKELKMAKTIGVWQQGKDSGFFTVLVYRNGLDHGSETTRVLVKKVHTSSKGISELEIIKTIDIDAPSISGSVEDIHLQIINNKLLIGLDINMRGMNNTILRHSMLVDTNGTVKVLQEAKYDDTIHD